MKKEILIIFTSFLLLGILANASFIKADKDDSNQNNSPDSVISASNDSEDDDLEDADDGDVEDVDEGDANDDENQTEIEIQDGNKKMKIKIHAGDDAEKIKKAIKERNRFRFNSLELPENCTRTGSVIKCDVEGKQKLDVEVSGNVNLSSGAQSTLDELVASINNSQEELEIKIKIEKDGNETEIESEVEEGTLTASQQVLFDSLAAQLTELIENEEGDAKIEIKIEREFERVRAMAIFAGKSGNVIIQVKGINATTQVQLYKSNGSMYGININNETILINYLPDQIKEKIRERTKKAKLDNTNMTLNENGEYDYRAEKEARFLGVFKVKEKVRFHIDPETGQILNENAPWWGFLAKDVEEEELLGESCGTVTPGLNDECCQNKGYTSWNSEEEKCV